MLYELLTGTPPFTEQQLVVGFDEMLRIIREEEPPKPSTRLTSSDDACRRSRPIGKLEPSPLDPAVRGELDWIVMKALEKDRTRRYESANGSAADIERHLHDEPVSAGPPRTGYRLRKLVRCNKGAVLATTIAVLLLLGGIVGTTWQAFRAQAVRALCHRAKGQSRSQLSTRQRRRRQIPERGDRQPEAERK